MSTTTITPTPTTPLTTEQKIVTAIAESAQIVSMFNPAAAAAVAAGAEFEPIVSGMIQMFIALFRHKVTKPTTTVTSSSSGNTTTL